MKKRRFFHFALTILLSCGVGASRGETSEKVDFAREVLPIFQANCLSCHGPEKQKNGLRVDSRDSLLKGGDYGPAVVPGEPEKSLLYLAVSGGDPNVAMPPKGDPLTDDQVAILRAWIEQGAEWSGGSAEVEKVQIDHWAFQPVQRPEIPEVRDKDWVANPLDAFILRKLEGEGVEPSRPADRWTLIRRLSLDLTGLPPTPDEVEYFVNDTSPYAYERLVTRLLASSHFGERWGRHWLDLARYADSDGYEKDLVRPHAWRYREWVIDALNQDLPYDQFVTEQLAGDLLPNPSTDQLVATGFHRNTLTNKEGGVDKEEDRVKQNVDRVNTTCSVFLGLTMECCQCHSHKYDPLTQREYYGFYGFFNQALEKDIPAALPAQVQQYKEAKADWEVTHTKIKKDISEAKKKLAERLPQWESDNDYADVKWELLAPVSMSSEGGASFKLLEDGSILLEGESPETDTYQLFVNTNLAKITGFRLAVLTDESLPKTGPGRAHHGNFILSEFEVAAAKKGFPDTAKDVVFKNAWSDHHEEGYGVTKAIDGDRGTGWSIEAWKGLNQNREAYFITEEEIGHEEGTTLRFTFDHQYGTSHTIGRLQLYAYTGDREKIDDVPPDLPEILATAPEERTNEQKDRLLDFVGRKDSKVVKVYSALDAHKKAEPKEPDTMAQTLAQNPKDVTTQIHIRGDFLRKGEVVQPHTPTVLTVFKPRNGKPDRLDLARWIVSPENPLTARVAANRIWQHIFGDGIVETSEDFGTRGEPPTHPELLDWLASEFVSVGWSQKEMIKLIVLSSTYQQVSFTRPELEDRDPRNDWLARQNRYRVEAEVVRDLSLATSGLLNRTTGGPSIRPPLPPGVAELGYARSVKWQESTGEDKYRRGMYILFQRTVPYPMLMTFDCPDSNVSCIRRAVSNTPLQALTLLNDETFSETSQALGRRLLAFVSGDEVERIRKAFLFCLSREPGRSEIATLKSLLADQRKIYSSAEEETVRNAAGGEAAFGFDLPETAAWVALARVVLNLDEFVTRE